MSEWRDPDGRYRVKVFAWWRDGRYSRHVATFVSTDYNRASQAADIYVDGAGTLTTFAKGSSATWNFARADQFVQYESVPPVLMGGVTPVEYRLD